MFRSLAARSLLAGLVALVLGASAGASFPTEFSYQGVLHYQGEPVNGQQRFRSSLWDAANLGQGSMLDSREENAEVVDGLFALTLRFSRNDLGTDVRWLQMEVRNEQGMFVVLGPRQMIGAAPYALHTYGIEVTESGRVGIGTSSPQDKLHVVGTIRGSTLRLVGGADIAEPFDVKGPEDVEIVPGMVVAIDATSPGELKLSDAAYDACAAGIISGANGINAGMTLSQADTIADGTHPVALSGRVWCLVDADANGPVVPGDLLTTSDTVGHAMKATDRERCFGASIGKAMTPLESGRGLVLVLVNLH
ncbi:MAG: hypothetical protein KDA21_13405 [Phycisphaerales bacterium]|nr:hypothetical protein [Phycisphaerales bacterium]